MCSQSDGQGVSGVKPGSEYSHQSEKVRVLQVNTADIRKPVVPGAEEKCIIKTLICQKGGEGVSTQDLEKLKGEHRFATTHFSSPTSKKFIQKSRSVANIRKMFTSSLDKGGGGSASVIGETKSESQNVNEENIPVQDHPQNWRQKLLVFRAEQS